MFFRRLQQMDGREAQSGAKAEEGCCSLLLQRCWANGAGGLVFVHLNLTETPQRLPQISCSLKIGPRENAVGSNSLSVAGPRAQADQVRAGPLTIDKALLRGERDGARRGPKERGNTRLFAELETVWFVFV